MNSQELRNWITSFWFLHISGWLLFYVFIVISYWPLGGGNFKIIYWELLIAIQGGLITTGLRYYYIHINHQTISISTLLIRIIIATIVGSLIWYGADLLLDIIMQDEIHPTTPFSFRFFIYNSLTNVSVIGGWSALYFVIKIWLGWREQNERTETANLLAQSAQLQMLRYQLNPHFLFNSLSSIRALIEEDETNAKNLINKLAEFLRYSLISKSFSDVPLREELAAVKLYLEIEKIRYEEKLDVNYDIDPASEEFPVLSFLIYPIVENAIKYGFKTSLLPLKINIVSRVEGERLDLSISNSGKWIQEKEDGNNGSGLQNIKQRLANAFPNGHSFRIKKTDGWIGIEISIEKSK